jgi:NADP-dependent 3-hydroxy acid dehydrogenase YdfG
MNIVITGHSRGLGQAIYNKLVYYNTNNRHHVTGYDLETGDDISRLQTIAKIVWQSKNFDIFINNAYHPTGQTDLLKYFIKAWNRNESKTIVHIGSMLVNESNEIISTFSPTEIIYTNIKKYQKELIKDHQKNDKFLKIIQINPGVMNTALLKTLEYSKPKNIIYQDPTDVADVVINSINMIEKNVFIKEINFYNLYSK